MIAMRLALRSSCFFRSLDVLSLRWWDAVVWMGPCCLMGRLFWPCLMTDGIALG